jgi:formate/nitrite transporter FocA (FNT family)
MVRILNMYVVCLIFIIIYPSREHIVVNFFSLRLQKSNTKTRNLNIIEY